MRKVLSYGRKKRAQQVEEETTLDLQYQAFEFVEDLVVRRTRGEYRHKFTRQQVLEAVAYAATELQKGRSIEDWLTELDRHVSDAVFLEKDRVKSKFLKANLSPDRQVCWGNHDPGESCVYVNVSVGERAEIIAMMAKHPEANGHG
jgi:hypothetical protein